jgi:hypothetical protein
LRAEDVGVQERVKVARSLLQRKVYQMPAFVFATNLVRTYVCVSHAK